MSGILLSMQSLATLADSTANYRRGFANGQLAGILTVVTFLLSAAAVYWLMEKLFGDKNV
jgi:hypothetical protein